MRIGLFFNHKLDACAEAAFAIRSAFAGESGVDFVDGDADADHGDIDSAVSIGGDGTFLLTLKTIKGRGAPLYGINMGRLGFLASGKADSAVADVARIAARDYETSRMIPLRADISEKSKIASVWAFNEIMIAKKLVSRPIALSVFLGGEKLYGFLSDGIIASTPAGSTAYALSAGGPIVHPDVSCVSIVPICAHSLSTRPMLVPRGVVVTITLDLARDGAELSGDGRIGAGLSSGDSVSITADAGSGVDIIKLNGGLYTDVLRDKLNWA